MRHILSLSSELPHVDLEGMRVLLRADLNVPIANTHILNDYRLKAIVPTLELIKKKGGKIILATHIGRPTSFTANLSTSLLLPWFKHHGYTIAYEANLQTAVDKSHTFDTDILLLENLRFFPGEKEGDATFAQTLANMGDYYVNDAFALLHRSDTSITLVPQLFQKDRRTIGLLIEHELRMLNRLIEKPKKPFVLALGGGKVADKLPLLDSLIDSVDTILLCPAIVFTFLKAQGKQTGKSLVDDAAVEECKKILEKADQKKVSMIFPQDYQIARNSFYGPLSLTDAQQFPADGVGISIGPKTIELFAQKIEQAQTIFYNG
ncbi:MAG TPA: phosphoglycerate kinase, partial [Candidatus Babeliales bacterium]|nr:phosphoglycerate kinase [Candidatus Babeliales bacterium]